MFVETRDGSFLKPRVLQLLCPTCLSDIPRCCSCLFLWAQEPLLTDGEIRLDLGKVRWSQGDEKISQNINSRMRTTRWPGRIKGFADRKRHCDEKEEAREGAGDESDGESKGTEREIDNKTMAGGRERER